MGFYGSGIAAELGDPRCPTMLVFGGRDEFIPRGEVDAVVAHHPGSLLYPEAGHGFMRDGSDSYDAASATDAWARMLIFLSEHLGLPLRASRLTPGGRRRRLLTARPRAGPPHR